MNAHIRAWLLSLAVLALALACGEPSAISGPGAEPSIRLIHPSADHQLLVQAGVKYEEVGAGFQRLAEITARFAVDPIDASQQSPQVEDLRFEFELEPAGNVVPCFIFFIPGTAWTAGDGGSFKIGASDPQSLPAVIQFLREENDQVVDDLTGTIEAVEARLEFLADEKAWEITLELTGIQMPLPIFGLVGAREASLQIGGDLVSSEIREGEALYASLYGAPALELTAAAQVEEVGAETIRERVEIAAHFGIDPIDASQQSPQVEDLRLEFELNPAGGVVPCWMLIIPGTAWIPGDGGGFKIEASDPQSLPAVIQILKEENGQVVADLTGEVEALEARLEFLADEKVWELTLELRGIVMPSTIVTPSDFHWLSGAYEAYLRADTDLVSGDIREGEASFF